MASLVERLQWIVTADGSSAINAFKQVGSSAEKELKKAEDASKNFGTSLTKFGALGAAAGGILGAALIKTASSFENLALTSSKLADTTGLSVQASSKWIEVTSDMGVSSESLGTALNKMNKTLGATPQVFAKYGVAVAHAKDGTVDVNQTFLNVVDRLNAIPNATDKAAAATAILGKGWTSLSELISTGSTTLKQSLDAVSSAKTITPAEAQKAKDYRAAIDNLTDSIDNLVISVGQGAAPVIGKLASVIGGAINAFDQLDAVTGGFVGKVATIAALGVGVAGVGGVLVGQAIKITSNLTSAAGAVGKYTSGIAAKRAAEAASAAATEAQTVALGTFSEANAASIGSINARSAALGAETGSIEANTVALEANAGAQATFAGGLATGGITSGAGIVFLASSLGALVGEAQHAQAASSKLSGSFAQLASATTAASSIEDMANAYGDFLERSLASGGQQDSLKKFVDQDIDGAKRLTAALKSGAIERTSATDGYVKILDAEIAKQEKATGAASGMSAAQQVVNENVAEGAGLLDGLSAATKTHTDAELEYGKALAQSATANQINAAAEAEYTRNATAAAAEATDRHAAVAAAVTTEAQAAKDAAAKWAAYATAIAGIGDTTGTLDNQVSAFSTALSSSADDASATLKANLSLDDSYAKLKQSFKDNGKGVDESTSKGRANIAAILDVGSAIRDNLVRQLDDAGGNYDKVTASADLYRAQLSKQLTQAGLTKAQIADYIKTLGLTPDQITTDIKLTGEAQAKAALDSLNVNIDDIPDSKKTEFIADVKSGDYQAALALFEQITADKTTKIDPSVDPAARAKAEDQLKALTDPLNAKVTADANTAAAEAKLQAFADSPPGVDLTVTPDIAAARAAIQRGLNNTVVNVKLNPVKGAFASGTKSAEPGPASVAETGPEIILDEDGARLVKDPSVVMMRGGEKVYTASETAAILAGGAGTGAGMKLPGYAGGTGSPINGTGSAQQTYNLVIAPTQTAAAASTSSGVDDAIKEQDRLQAAEYHTNRISLDQYKQYVAGRLAASADLSDDYLTQYDLLQQLADTEKQTAADRAQAAKDAADAETQAAADAIAAQDDLMKNEAALGVISQAQYKDYLAGRLGTYAQYSDGYTQIALQIKAIDDQSAADGVKAAQDSADQQLKIYKQLQANKAVVDAEAEQDRQTAAVRDAGAAGSKVQNDRHSTADDRAQAVQALSDAQTKLADDTYKTILSKASAENLTEGSVDWDRFVSGLLRSAIDTFNQNGFVVTAAALGGDLSGIPQLAKGGIVKKRPGGHLVNVAEAGHDEAIVPLPANGQMFGGNTTNHFHLPPGWSAEHALIATNEQAARRGYRAA